MLSMKRSTLLLFILLLTGALFAQRNLAPPVTLESPKNTIWVHLYYLQADSYQPEEAAKAMPLELDSADRVEKAIELKQVLDGKGLFVRLNELPADPNYIDSTIMQSVYTPFPSELPQVYLEKVGGKWYYSRESIAELDRVYSELYPLGTEYLLDIAPKWSMKEFGGLKLWQWLGLVGFFIVGYILHLLLKLIIRPIIGKQIIGRLHLVDEKSSLRNRLVQVLSLLLVFFILKRLYPALQLPVRTAEFFRVGLAIFIGVLVAVLLYRITRVVIVYLEKAAEATESKMDDQVLPVIERSITVMIVVGTLFYVLSKLNVNVTALIAGLSIGGIALALAAQDTVKNLIGSIMIFMDKPFQVGDFVEIGGQFGSIIEVGFRSTRIMTKDSSVVSIPNGQVANMNLRNLGVRRFRLLETEISLTYDTPAYLIEQFIEGVRKLMRLHPLVMPEEQYVYFSKMADSSLNVFVRVNIDTQVWAEELDVKQELYLDIIRMADEMGIRFAFPSRTLYIEDFPEKKSLVPDYSEARTDIEQKRDRYLAALQEKYEQRPSKADPPA